MRLSKKDVEKVLQMITVTRDDEIDCEGFLDKMSVFAETELAGEAAFGGARARLSGTLRCALNARKSIGLCWRRCVRWRKG